MALVKTQPTDQPWKTPTWPAKLPPAETMRAVYGPEADELTIHFPDAQTRDIVVVWVATPEVEYTGLMVYEHTGEVVGVQVDYLADYAALRHPAWRSAIEPRPKPAVTARIVTDIRELFERYGTDPGDPERG